MEKEKRGRDNYEQDKGPRKREDSGRWQQEGVTTRRNGGRRVVLSSRRRHAGEWRDWSSDVCSSDLSPGGGTATQCACWSRSKSGSSIQRGRSRPRGTSTRRRRNAGMRWMRSASMPLTTSYFDPPC